jgi:Mg-chelatase subunit ChlD
MNRYFSVMVVADDDDDDDVVVIVVVVDGNNAGGRVPSPTSTSATTARYVRERMVLVTVVRMDLLR